MCVLVTGGAGFIGSHIAAILSQQNQDVAICDWLGKEDKWKNLQKTVPVAIVPPENLHAWLKDNSQSIFAVVHMGAISATTETDVDLIINSNFTLSVALWHFCSRVEIPFIYASSAATYGDGKRGFEDKTDDTNMSQLKPLNPYGWSKHLFDRWVLKQVNNGLKHPPKWAGLKFFNVYGPNEYHKGSMKSVIAQNYEKIISGEAIRLFKSYNPDYVDGGQMRDFIYVKDCVKVIAWMLENHFKSDIYNVGSGTARSWNDLGRSIFSAIGIEPKFEYIEMPDELRGRYQYFTEASMDKIKSVGCPVDFFSLEDGIADYVNTYLSAEDPYF